MEKVWITLNGIKDRATILIGDDHTLIFRTIIYDVTDLRDYQTVFAFLKRKNLGKSDNEYIKAARTIVKAAKKIR